MINKTRSHNLKFPIFLGSQDPNSDGIKLVVYPNDEKILYYEITRRNLTANERRFAVPRNKSTEFWSQNKFFVEVLDSGSLFKQGTVDLLTKWITTSSN